MDKKVRTGLSLCLFGGALRVSSSGPQNDSFVGRPVNATALTSCRSLYSLSTSSRAAVVIKTLYMLPSANQNSIYIEPVRAKTLYTLASADQNSMHIASLRRETLYTLSQLEQKLYIH